MMIDVIERSLRAPNRLIPVEALLNRADGGRMPEVRPALLTAEIAQRAADICPTSALSLAQPQEHLLRLDYGKCIGCGRCAELEPFVIAERLTCCGATRQD